MAVAETTTPEMNLGIPPPAHPTYDLLHIIRLALAEDAGDQGQHWVHIDSNTPDYNMESSAFDVWVTITGTLILGLQL